ncbi:hypothetical protein GOL94_27575 [Sinorhizobium medicae]|nr:hypothetical protein [Sinorhizobium medicae]MDX0846159.1 hypothetical protein [Sinorhizobium medicae]MDX1201095.1 hypothetical protein [Sinorhizobium medicae]
MTIAERKAREAHDRENPWRPMHEAKPDGLLCNLLFNDLGGYHSPEETKYFLDADGYWYRKEPPGRVYEKPMNWRPAYVRLTAEVRSTIKNRCEVSNG